MADVVTFDPANLRIIEINTGQAVNELDALEIYSEWKDYLLGDFQRLGHPQAFTPVGGDPRTATESLGITYFLENRWRIRPAEYSHKLVVKGNIFTREEGESIFVPTLGAFNVHTETVVSNIIDLATVSTGIGTPTQVADAVWQAPYNTTPGTVGDAIYRTFVMLGLHPTIETVHDKTFIKAPADGSTIDLQIIKDGSKVTVLRKI